MKTRVNLTIEKDLVAQIKAYAAKKHVSVSDLVEEYFTHMVKPAKKRNIFDLLDSLEKPVIDETLDLKRAYYEEQSKKYGF